MLKKIQHIAIAVRNLDESVRLFRDILGLEFIGEEEVAAQKVRVAFFRVGDARLELMEAISPDSPIRSFVEKRGGGLHHIAFEVDDLPAALQTLRQRGASLLTAEPAAGAHGSRVAFGNPKSFANVLIELIQPGEHGENN